MNIINLKNVICAFCSIILFINLIIGYKDFSRKRLIIENSSPVEVVVKKLHKGRSRNSCEVEYKGLVYKSVAVPITGVQINEINKKDFYFDDLEQIIISNNIGKRALIVCFVLFIISLILWFIPAEKFKW